MPDNKPTDSEIIKALKTLLELVLVEGCLQRAKTISLALDLINRLQAEKQNLEIELKAMRGAANSYKAENKRLYIALEENQKATKFWKDKSETAKAEAHKEFWKELYVEMRMYGQQEKFTKSVFLSVADKVLKELVGDKK